MHDPTDPAQADRTLLRDSIRGLRKASFRGKEFLIDDRLVSEKLNTLHHSETRERSPAGRFTNVPLLGSNGFYSSGVVSKRYYRRVSDGKKAWIEETNHPDQPESWKQAPEQQ